MLSFFAINVATFSILCWTFSFYLIVLKQFSGMILDQKLTLNHLCSTDEEVKNKLG
jgi:hypothetical protein